MNIFPLRKPAPTILYPRLDAPTARIPLYVSKVPAGAFPSPAEEYIEKLLDLNELLTPNPIAALFFKAAGESMRDANIFDGSICAVDRSLVPRHGHIVLAAIDGEFTVKRLCVIDGVTELHPANPAFKPMRFSECQEVRIVGVVRGVVSKFAV
jgi:DNA polymerase V